MGVLVLYSLLQHHSLAVYPVTAFGSSLGSYQEHFLPAVSFHAHPIGFLYVSDQRRSLTQISHSTQQLRTDVYWHAFYYYSNLLLYAHSQQEAHPVSTYVWPG